MASDRTLDYSGGSEWSRPLQRIVTLDQYLRVHREPATLQAIMDCVGATDSRRTWLRSLQLLASLGAPVVYTLDGTDSWYRYTHRQWRLWPAVASYMQSQE